MMKKFRYLFGRSSVSEKPNPNPVSVSSPWTKPQTSGQRPKDRHEHGAAVIQDKMYIYGGNHNGHYLEDLHILDLKNWTWSRVETKVATESQETSTPTVLAPCAGHSLIAWDNKLLSIGGHTKDPSESMQVKVFDPHTSTWSMLKTYGKPPVSRGGQSVTLVGKTLVIFGGQDAKRSLLNDLHILDLKTMTWDENHALDTSPSPRSGHAAAVHKERYLHIFGGFSHATYFNDLHIFDLQTMEWSSPVQQGDAPTPRAGHAGVKIGNNWFIAGGGDDKIGASDSVVLNMSTLTWSSVQGHVPLTGKGLSLVLSSNNGQDLLVAFGGYVQPYNNEIDLLIPSNESTFQPKTLEAPLPGSLSAVNDATTRDIESEVKVSQEDMDSGNPRSKWTAPQTSGLRPKARHEHGAAVIQGKMYIYGGNHNGSYLGDLHVLDLKNWTWSSVETKDIPETSTLTTAGHSLIPWDNKLFSVGGHTNDPSKSMQVMAFDPKPRTWSMLKTSGKPPVSRGGHSVTVVGDTLVIFGGQDAKRSPLNDLHILDLKTMTWDEKHAVDTSPSPRSGHAAAVHKERYLHIFGGFSHTTYFNDLHIFDLQTMEWSSPVQQGDAPTPRAGHAGVKIGNNWFIAGGGDDKIGASESVVLNMSTLTWSSVQGHVPLTRKGLSLVLSSYNGEDVLVAFGGFGRYYNKDIAAGSLSYGSKVPQWSKWNQIRKERAEFKWSKKFSPLEPQDPLGTFYDGCVTMLTQRAFREFEYSTRESPRVRAKISEMAMRSQNVFASVAGGIIGEDSPYSKMKSYKGLDGAFATFRFLIPVVIAVGFKAYEMYDSNRKEKRKISRQQKSANDAISLQQKLDKLEKDGKESSNLLQRFDKLEKDLKEDQFTRSMDQITSSLLRRPKGDPVDLEKKLNNLRKAVREGSVPNPGD